MSDTKGEFHVDIPEDAIADALRSVEKRAAEAAAEEGDTFVLDDDASGETSEASADTQEATPEAEEVRKLRAMLEDSASRGAQTQKRLEETHERFVRVSADFDNFRKRAAREKEETVRLGNERLLKDLLPVVDNLERALAAGGADAEGLLTGIRMVHKQFVETLARYGVSGFSAVGEVFDPSRHEALMQQETADVAPGTVVSEMVKGYFLNDRLVRPAAVVVARAPEPAPEQTTDAGQSSEPADVQ